MPCDGVVRIPNSHPEVRSPTRLACRQRVTPDLSPFLRRGFRRRLKELSTDSSRVTDPPETSLIQKRDPCHHGSPRWALSPRDDILFELLNATRVPSSWQYAPTAPTAHHARKKNPSCYRLLISYLLILLTASFFLQKGKKEVSDHTPFLECSITCTALSCCLLVVIFSKANSHLSSRSLKRRVFLCS